MPLSLPLPQEKKITFTCFVEPGCLGPEGIKHILEFCTFAEQEITFFDPGLIIWKMKPRYNKQEDEIQYSIHNKSLNREQAARFISVFDRDIDDIENFINDFLVRMIDQYFER